MDSAYLPQQGQPICKPHEERRRLQHQMSTRKGRSLSLLQLMSTEAQRPEWIQKLQNNRRSTEGSEEETEQLQRQQQEQQPQQQEQTNAWVHDEQQQKEASGNYQLSLSSHGQRTHQQQHQWEILSDKCMRQWQLVHSQTERRQQLPPKSEEKQKQQKQQQEFCSQRQIGRFHAEVRREEGGRNELMKGSPQSSVPLEPQGLYQPPITIKPQPLQEEQHRPEMLQQQSMQLWHHDQHQRCRQYNQGGLETHTQRQGVPAKDETAPSVEKRATTAASSCTGDSLWITATYDKAEAQQPYCFHIHNGQRYISTTICKEESKQNTTNGNTLRPLCHINLSSSCSHNSSSHSNKSKSRSSYSHCRNNRSSSSSSNSRQIKEDRSYREGNNHNASKETVFAGGVRECSTQTACSRRFTRSNSCCYSSCSSRKSSIYHDTIGHEDGSCCCATCHSTCVIYTNTSGHRENVGCCCDTYQSIRSYKERASSSTYSDIRMCTTKSTQSRPLFNYAPPETALARAEKDIVVIPPVTPVHQDDAVTSTLTTLRGATETVDGAEKAIIDRKERRMADAQDKERYEKHIQMWRQTPSNMMLSCILSQALEEEEKKEPTNTAEHCSLGDAYKCAEEVTRSAVAAEKATSRVPSSENMTAAAKAATFLVHASAASPRRWEESAILLPPARVAATAVLSAEEPAPLADNVVEPSSGASIGRREESTILSPFETIAATALPSAEAPVEMVVAACGTISSAAGPSTTNDGPIALKSTEHQQFARLPSSSCRSEETCEGDRDTSECVSITATDKSLVSSDVYATDIQAHCNNKSLLSLQEKNKKFLYHCVSAPVSGIISATRRKRSSDRSVITANSENHVACRDFVANAEPFVTSTTASGTVASSLPYSTPFISTRPSFSRHLPPTAAAVNSASTISLKSKHHFQPSSNVEGAAAAASAASVSSIQANIDASLTFPQNIHSAYTVSTDGNTVSPLSSSRVALNACTSAAAAATDVLPHAPAKLQHIPPCAASSSTSLCLHTPAAAEAGCSDILSPINLTSSNSITATAPGALATAAAARDAAVSVTPAATAAIACASPVEVAAAPTATAGATAPYATPTATADAAAEHSLEPAAAVAASTATADTAAAAAMFLEPAAVAAALAVHPAVRAATTTTTYTAPLTAPGSAIPAAPTAPAAAAAPAGGASPAVTAADAGPAVASASATAAAMTAAPTAVAMTAAPTAVAMTAAPTALGATTFVEVVCPAARDTRIAAAAPLTASPAPMAEVPNATAAAPPVDAAVVAGAVAAAPTTTTAAAMTAPSSIRGAGTYAGIGYPVASDNAVDAACTASRSSCIERVECWRLGCAAERRAKQRWRMLLRRSQRRKTRDRSSSSSSFCVSLSSSLSSYASTSSHSETDEENSSEDMGVDERESWERQQQQQIHEQKEATAAQQQQQQPEKSSQQYQYESTICRCSVLNPIIGKGSLHAYTKDDSAVAGTTSAAVAVSPPRPRSNTCATASADINSFSSDVNAPFPNKNHHCVIADRSSHSTAISTYGELANRGDADRATWESSATTVVEAGDAVSLSVAAAASSDGRSSAVFGGENTKRREEMRRCCAPGPGVGSSTMLHLHQKRLEHRFRANRSCSAVADTHMFASAGNVCATMKSAS